jgi:hypothetical protein
MLAFLVMLLQAEGLRARRHKPVHHSYIVAPQGQGINQPATAHRKSRALSASAG